MGDLCGSLSKPCLLPIYQRLTLSKGVQTEFLGFYIQPFSYTLTPKQPHTRFFVWKFLFASVSTTVKLSREYNSHVYPLARPDEGIKTLDSKILTLVDMKRLGIMEYSWTEC